MSVTEETETPTDGQDRQWSRHASRYDELFLDPFRPGVTNPLIPAIESVESPETRTAADLGCGTGPLLPTLVSRFQRVFALDFAPGMIAKAKKRLGANAKQVRFLKRSMHELDDLKATLDLAVAVNSIVMPDVRDIDRVLSSVREALKPDGVFLGILPAMDAIHYHTMLLYEQGLSRDLTPEEAERHAGFYGEHQYYDFAFGRFQFLGLRQKFWQPFEISHRMTKAGFASVRLEKVLYPWDENLAGFEDFSEYPRSWDWFFLARP